MDPDVLDDDLRIVALSGESESGKSSAGRFFERNGWARIKIADIYRSIFAAERPAATFLDWSIDVDQRAPEWISGRFLELLRARLADVGSTYCTIESLYGDALAQGLKRLLGARFIILYLDVPQPVRLVRQMGREGLASLAEAEALMLPRDEMKRAWGVLRVREMADEIVDNSGAVEGLERQLAVILQRHRP